MDDIRIETPAAGETTKDTDTQAPKPLREVGPESEVRGGPEADTETLD